MHANLAMIASLPTSVVPLGVGEGTQGQHEPVWCNSTRSVEETPRKTDFVQVRSTDAVYGGSGRSDSAKVYD